MYQSVKQAESPGHSKAKPIYPTVSKLTHLKPYVFLRDKRPEKSLGKGVSTSSIRHPHRAPFAPEPQLPKYCSTHFCALAIFERTVYPKNLPISTYGSSNPQNSTHRHVILLLKRYIIIISVFICCVYPYAVPYFSLLRCQCQC